MKEESNTKESLNQFVFEMTKDEAELKHFISTPT